MGKGWQRLDLFDTALLIRSAHGVGFSGGQSSLGHDEGKMACFILLDPSSRRYFYIRPPSRRWPSWTSARRGSNIIGPLAMSWPELKDIYSVIEAWKYLHSSSDDGKCRALFVWPFSYCQER